MTKQELRAFFKEVRGGISPKDRAAKSRVICEKFLSLPRYKNAETVMIYMNIGSEPETRLIAEAVLRSGKRLAVPKCAATENEIFPCIIENLDCLAEGKCRIPEPKETRVCDKSEIDIAAVPALAFDRQGFRLGYGGGYYDRFLSGFGGFSAGLCFSECLTDELPRGEFDRRTDTVLTD